MSCLFISLGKLLDQPHTAVRHTICNYMHNNLDRTHQGMTLRDWIRWQRQAPSPAAYIRAMRSTAEWGGAMELAVATQCYHVDIDVVDGRGCRATGTRTRTGRRCRASAAAPSAPRGARTRTTSHCTT